MPFICAPHANAVAWAKVWPYAPWLRFDGGMTGERTNPHWPGRPGLPGHYVAWLVLRRFRLKRRI